MAFENFQRISQSTQLRFGICSVHVLRLELRNEFLVPRYAGLSSGNRTVIFYYCHLLSRRFFHDGALQGHLTVGFSVGETRIPKSGADREDAPAIILPHVWDFAQPLNDGIVVHYYRRFLFADFRNQGMEYGRQIELAALPIARQVLGPFFDGAVFFYEARAANSDERRQLHFPLAGR